GVVEVTQDRSLDLLAVGTKDTSINDVDYTLAAIYRIDAKKGNSFDLDHAKINNTIVHPFYFKSSFSSSDANVRFTGIDVMADNKYYVARSGPDNNTSKPGGPDDAMLLFNNHDEFKTPISVTTSQGFHRDYFKDPTSVSTVMKPPQSFNVNESEDFIFSSRSPERSLKVQYIELVQAKHGKSYEVKDMPQDTSKANGFLLTSDRFNDPSDVTYTGDGTNYIFVTDAKKDSLYQFTNTGLEGIQPPPGSNKDKNIIASFGGSGSGPKSFRNPHGVAYFKEVVYVADKGNGRVLRFKLTTDFE
ncbi:MAG: hypothetical protein ABEH43_07135, partial [Flavobacteriales bacterium]